VQPRPSCARSNDMVLRRSRLRTGRRRGGATAAPISPAFLRRYGRRGRQDSRVPRPASPHRCVDSREGGSAKMRPIACLHCFCAECGPRADGACSVGNGSLSLAHKPPVSRASPDTINATVREAPAATTRPLHDCPRTVSLYEDIVTFGRCTLKQATQWTIAPWFAGGRGPRSRYRQRWVTLPRPAKRTCALAAACYFLVGARLARAGNEESRCGALF